MAETTSATRIDEIETGIYRIHTAVPAIGGFSFNQYLVVDEAPLLFHTGPRALFPAVRAAAERVLPVEKLRYVAFSHFEADECGSLNDWLSAAPGAVPVCSRIAALTSVADTADRAPKALADGEELDLGGRRVRWIDAPHLPHGWESGYLHDPSTGTLFCGDLFTQPGAGDEPVTTADVLGPSEALRRRLDYFAVTPRTGELLERMARESPSLLAVMHGHAWRGDGAALLRALSESLRQSFPSAAGGGNLRE